MIDSPSGYDFIFVLRLTQTGRCLKAARAVPTASSGNCGQVDTIAGFFNDRPQSVRHDLGRKCLIECKVLRPLENSGVVGECDVVVVFEKSRKVERWIVTP